MGNDRYQEIREALAMEPWVENDNYTLAHILVSERHGQFDLVRLVAYLLQECASTQTDDALDAARYRWLRKGDNDDIAVVRGLGAMDYGMSVVVSTYSEEIDGDDLDAVIDAAMLKAREGA